MRFKVFKRVIALALTVLLCIGTLPVFGLTYSPGPIEYELDKSYLLETKNADITSGKLVFDKGGMMKFDLLLPFDAVSLEISYEKVEETVNFSITTDADNYKAVLTAEDTKATVAIHELCKSNTIIFKADNPVKVTGVKFIKVNEQYNEFNTELVPYSKYEEAILTLVALKAGVGAVKTKGSILRWDPSNIYLAPKNINGSIYAPIKKFAESLGYYCEDYQDLSYVYLLGEQQSLILKNGKGYYEGNKDGKKDITIDIKYQDGYTWAPVRAIAETLGFTVDYKDGYVLIGDRLRVKNVIESKTYFPELQEEMEVYKIPDKKTVGKTYHVAQTDFANDKNDGTENFPFRSISKAAEIAKAGDTVIIHEGTYRETVTPKNDGTVFAPITFTAAEGEKVVISALEPISGFTKYKGDILYTPVHNDLGFGLNQLFYKGEALNAGRHPNEDTKPGAKEYPEYVPKGVYPTKGNIRITEQGGNVAYSDTDLDQEDNYWVGGSFITLKGEAWCIVGGEIVSSSKGKLVLKDYDGTKSFNLGISLPEGSQYKYYTKVHETDYGYITNHLNTVDIPGEWFMQDNVMYMIPPVGADLDSDFEIKDRMRTIDLRDRQYVTIKGINTIGGGVTISGNDAKGCVLDECNFKYIAHHSVLYDQDRYGLRPEEPKGSLMSVKAGEVGICLDGKYNSVINSTIDYSSGTGVTLLGKYHYVNNNVISNTSIAGGYPGGIWMPIDGDSVEREGNPIIGGHFMTYNTVYNGVRGILYIKTSYNNKSYPASACEIAYNRFFNGALASRDTGVTYEYGFTGGTDILKTSMHHNFVYNVGHVDYETSYMVPALYHDGLVANRDTYSNVLYYQREDLPYTPGEGVWVAAAAFTVIRDRNNSDLGYKPEGEFELTRNDFPGARPFLPGADHGQFARRFMDNYEDFVNNTGVYFPSEEKIDEKTGKETFVFENVKFIEDDLTQIYFYMDREYGARTSFDVVARLYDKDGNLIKEAEMGNSAWEGRFYVDEYHKGLIILGDTKEGVCRVELEIPDSYTNLFYMVVDNSLDTTYDDLYTKEMEANGVVIYPVSSTVLDEEKGTETFRVEDVPIKGGINTKVNLHGTREFNKENRVNITANIFDKSGNFVTSTTLMNTFNHAKKNQYEVLSGTAVIPRIEEGIYDIEFEFADTYSQIIRIMTEDADDSFDYLYNNSELILAGTYDDWIKGGGEMDVTATINYTPQKLETYEYFRVINCWAHTLIYEDREIAKESDLLKLKLSTGGSHAGSIVRVYVDSMDTKPIATFKTENSSWKVKQYEIPLERKLEAGKYTFYFDFEGDSFCSDFYNFSFDKKGK